MKYRLVLFFVFVTNLVLAQQWDSLNIVLSTDTLLQKSIQKADSITESFQSKADSLHAVYQSQLSKIDQATNRIQAKIDSLNQLKLPTEKLTRKLDSLAHVKDEKIKSFTGKMDDLKTKATKNLNEIQLPPELEEPMQKLKSSINGYSLPSLNTSASGIPSMDMLKSGNTQLPSLSKQLNLGTNLGGVSENLGSIREITDQAGEYTQDARQLVRGNLNEVKSIDKTLEARLTGMDELKPLQEGSALLASNKPDSAAMMDMAKEQLLNAAQDHFAGKQELLQQAMDKMNKLKSRYSEVQDMAALPKRLPNPLKGKPLIERLVPSVGFQIQKSGSFLLDVSPLLLYKITPRISAGAGWNQRFAIDDSQLQQDESIYGPRAALEVKLPKGFNVRLLPEIMNTTIPPLIAQSKGVDAAYREWIPSLFMGMKKDFTVYKQIKGYSEILYNLYDKDGMSPYGDKLSVRFGFEFPMKKKVKSVN
jgi:hypothetical protein